jgi:hypothetical protein
MASDGFLYIYKSFPNLQTVFPTSNPLNSNQNVNSHDSIEAHIITKENLCNSMNATIKYINPKLIKKIRRYFPT